MANPPLTIPAQHRLGLLCTLVGLSLASPVWASNSITPLSTPTLEQTHTQPAPVETSTLNAASLPVTLESTPSNPPPSPADREALQQELERLIKALQQNPEDAVESGVDQPTVAPPAHPTRSDSTQRVRLDTPVGALLAELSASDSQQQALGLTQLEALHTWYALNDYQKIWFDPAHREAMTRAISDSRHDGLEPDFYHLALLQELQSPQHAEQHSSLRHQALLDVLLSDAYLQLHHDYRHGMVDHARLMPAVASATTAPTPLGPSALQTITQSPEAMSQAIKKLAPVDARIERFRTQLAYYRYIQSLGGWPEIGEGDKVSPGDADPRVSAIRQRLELSGDAEEHTTVQLGTLDAPLSEAVKRFQRRHFLADDGIVGESTRAAMNVSVEQRIQQLITNLDRYRFMKARLHGDYVAVNVAGYQLELVQNNAVIWRTRTVVGKPRHQTPLFSDTIRHVVVNPYWNIPRSILREEILPSLKNDPSKLDQQQLEVLDQNNQVVNPQTINWSSVDKNDFPYRVRQRPGRHNALGQVKFMFPNKHSVYLHDTPSKALFKQSARAFSHGCIRVEHPLELMRQIIAMQPELSQQRVDQTMAKGAEAWIKLPDALPVHLLYFTADVDDSHQALFMPDIYQHDQALLMAYTNDYLSQPPSHAGLLRTLDPLLASR